MAQTENLKGGKELVKKYEDELTEVNNSIEEMEKTKEKSEQELEKHKNKPTVEAIKKQTTAKNEIRALNEFLEEAHTQKEQIMKQIKKNSNDEAFEVVFNHSDSIRNDHTDINEKIEEHWAEIEKLMNDLTNYEKEERHKVGEFVRAVLPYLKKEDDDEGVKVLGRDWEGYTDNFINRGTEGSNKFFYRSPKVQELFKLRKNIRTK